MNWFLPPPHPIAWMMLFIASVGGFESAAIVVAAEPAANSTAVPEARELEELDQQLEAAVKKADKKEQESLHQRAAETAERWYQRAKEDAAAMPEVVAVALQAAIDRRNAWGEFLSGAHEYVKAVEVYQALQKRLTPVVDGGDWRLVDARLAEREAARYASYSLLDTINYVSVLASASQALPLIQQGRYREAIAHMQKTAESVKTICGVDSPEYFQASIGLAGTYKEAGNYAEAEAGFERAVKLAEEIYGKRHPQYAEALNMQGTMRFSQNRYAEAAKLFLECLKIYRGTIGEDQQIYALGLNNLAACYNNLERFNESEPLLKRALELQRKLVGEQHERVALSLNNLGYLYDMQGRDVDAESAYRQSIEIYEKVSGPQHPNTLDSVQLLADLFQRRGKYADAEPLYLRVRDGRKATLGDKHPNYGAILTSIGFLYRTQGAYSQAEPLLKEALEIAKASFGTENSGYANALNNLGSLYWSQGSYERAAEVFQQALEIYAKNSGTDDSWYAQTLANLGAAYNEMGRYVDAEPVLRRALEIYERKLGPNSTQLALTLGNLSATLNNLGDRTEAEKLVRRSVEIYRKAYGEKHIDYARMLSGLAYHSFAQDDLPHAETLYRESLDAYRAAVGEEHPEVASALYYLARTKMHQNRLAEAEQLMRRSHEMQVKAVGEKHADYVETLPDFGSVLLLQNRLDEAEAVFQRGIELTEKEGVITEDCAMRFYNGLGRVAHARGDEVAAERYARQAMEMSFAWSANTMQSQSERRQLALVTTNLRYFSNYLTIALDSGKFADSAYRFAFHRKGNAWMQQRRIRAVVDDPQAAPLFAELRTVASRLAQQAMNAPKPELREVWQKEVEDLTRQKESLEAKLAASSEAYRRSQQPITVEDLQAALPADAALVDFVEYGYLKKPSAAGLEGMVEPRFAAFVIRPGRPVELIDLGDVKPTTAAIDRWRGAYGVHRSDADGIDPEGVAAGKQLRQQLWEPLEAQLADAKLVLISPDGALGRLPFAALPGRNADDYLLEDWALAVVPVPQAVPELLKSLDAPLPADVRNLLLVGGIDYDADAALAAATPKKSFGRRVTRGADWKGFGPLDGTIGEVAVIQKTYQEFFDAAGLTTLEKGAAVEERIISEAPKHQFLHIATHGFFAPPSLRSTIDSSLAVGSEVGGGGNRSSGGVASTVADMHPGLLSGLALAGCNRPVSADRADGILTAEEVQTLDLRHVRLAVLSACETGLGEVAGGEGVLGLQRAFQVAGAHSTVTSLWKVDDIQTRALMERFYRNIWDKELSLADALREAQLWMLREGMQRDARLRPQLGEPAPKAKKLSPYYWAAFVLSGDWRKAL